MYCVLQLLLAPFSVAAQATHRQSWKWIKSLCVIWRFTHARRGGIIIKRFIYFFKPLITIIYTWNGIPVNLLLLLWCLLPLYIVLVPLLLHYLHYNTIFSINFSFVDLAVVKSSQVSRRLFLKQWGRIDWTE